MNKPKLWGFQFFTCADSTSEVDKLILAQTCVLVLYFKFLSYKLFAYPKKFIGSVISQ